MEPDEKQNEIWRKITGSTKPASFNGLCAAMAMPVYLERLAEQHQRAGNTQAATEFRLEADRVRRIIAQA